MKIRLIVPNCDKGHKSPIKEYGPAIANIAGGFTTFQATGGWKDDQGQLIGEPVTVFDLAIAATPDDEGDVTRNGYPASSRIADLRDLAKQIARDLSQTCVYLEIDGVVEYVKG
jgi:hypothetical protein